MVHIPFRYRLPWHAIVKEIASSRSRTTMTMSSTQRPCGAGRTRHRRDFGARWLGDLRCDQVARPRQRSGEIDSSRISQPVIRRVFLPSLPNVQYRHDNTPKHQLARAVPRQFAPASVTKDQLTLETDRVNFPSHCHIVMQIRIVALAGWTLMAEVSTLSEHGRQLPGWRSFP